MFAHVPSPRRKVDDDAFIPSSNAFTERPPPLATLEWSWLEFTKLEMSGSIRAGVVARTTLPLPVVFPTVTWFAPLPTTGTPAVSTESAAVPSLQPLPSFQFRLPVESTATTPVLPDGNGPDDSRTFVKVGMAERLRDCEIRYHRAIRYYIDHTVARGPR